MILIRASVKSPLLVYMCGYVKGVVLLLGSLSDCNNIPICRWRIECPLGMILSGACDGVAGTGVETMLYAGLGGYNGVLQALKHPVASFGSDLALQYGLGNVQSESLASGAARTYEQQARELAAAEAQKAAEQFIQSGELHPANKNRYVQEQIKEWLPDILSYYKAGYQY